MASNLLATAFCGSVFGMALTAAGVHRPDVIIAQLTLQDFHMLESFLAAAAGSVALVTLFQRLDFTKLPPRGYSSMGLFGSLDGNIIGGLIQGTGMALAGSCPGTVFAQVGAGIQSGVYTLGGLIVGGILWTGFLQPYLQRRSSKKPVLSKPISVDKRLGLSQLATVAAIEGIFLSAIAIAVSQSNGTTRGLVHPVIGGLLIACAQLLSASTRKALLGTSTAFEEVGNAFWSVIGGRSRSTGTLSYGNIVFVSGMTIGARLLAWRRSAARYRVKIISYVTVAAMFTGAISTALLLYRS
ncbi:hypothetical protein TruAng_002748 [Truncatella angustata]|nr:hypothetical protein TruAng_002748 [Truncatella angustata]